MSATRASQRSRRRAAALTGAAAAACLVLASCTSGSGSGGSTGGGQGYDNGKRKTAIDRYAADKRQKAPELSGKTLEKKPLNVADDRGKVVVLNIWGSWCGPCRAEAKNLVKVANQTKDKGVAFVGINIRDPDPSTAVAFERTHDVPYPSIYDPSGKLLVGFRGTVPPQTIPTTLVLDRQGRVAARALKPLSEDDLRSILDPVMAEKR